MAVAVKKKKPPVDPFLIQAKQAVDASIAPERTDIANAVAKAETARAAAAAASLGITRAVADMSSGDAKAQQAAFQQAADRVASYGQGLTGAMRTDQLAEADKQGALVRTLGAPGAVESHANDNANVSYFSGAELPAGDLASRAATSMLAALDRRTATGARLADAAAAGDWKAESDISSIRDKLTQLESQRPGLILKALDTLHQQANAKRATDTQVGYLQLQQAKTVQDQAVALTNLTGTLHIVVGVGAKQHVVDTGRPAGGSDAAVVQQRAAQATADRNARVKAAQAANQTRLDIAKAAADARVAAANAAAEARKAAAQIAAQKAANKPPTAQQKAAVIKGAQTSGNSIVSAKINTWYANTPNLKPQMKGESLDDYAKRHAIGVKEFNNKKAYNFLGTIHVVEQTITPQLQVLGWTPQQIHQYARTVVAAQIVPPPGQ